MQDEKHYVDKEQSHAEFSLLLNKADAAHKLQLG